MTKLTASDAASYDNFGYAVSIDGDYAVTGSVAADVGAFVSQGVLYVYFQSGGGWNQQAKLTASDGSVTDSLGWSVSIDGDYIIGGALGDDADQGAAYIFFRSGAEWNQQAKLNASDGIYYDGFGSSVCIDGDYALVGAYSDDISGNVNQGSAYVFLRSGTLWDQQDKLLASDGNSYDAFGYSVSLSGDYAVIGSFASAINGTTNQGSAYMFMRSGSDWNQQAKLVASDGDYSDQFGRSVSIDGDYLVVGAWSDNVGSITDQGSAYVFHRFGTNWNQQAHLIKSLGSVEQYCGTSVSIKGSLIAIGSTGDDVTKLDQGSATLFSRSSTDWVELTTLVAPDPSASDLSGYSVSISNDNILIGTYKADLGPFADSGSAYVFFNNSGSWEFACDPGLNVIGSSATCEECELGKYKDWIGDTCLSCPVGRYADSTGSLSCTLCEAGKYNGLTGQFKCLDCEAGKYNPSQESTSISSCLDCSIGKYLPFSGGSNSSDCIDCPTGSYGTMPAADVVTDCLSCGPGKFASSTGALSCVDCGVDFVQPGPGQSFCSACQFGACTNDQTGQISCFDCSNSYMITSVFGCIDDIASGSTKDCPTAGGIELTITGSGWDFSTISEAKVSIGDFGCDTTAVGSGLVKCMLGEAVGLDLEVIVTKSSQGTSGSATKLSYSSGSIDSVHGCDNSEALPDVDGTSACSRDGIDEVTVTGNNFGPDQANVLIGGVKATQVPLSDYGLSGWEQNTTIVQVPKGSGLGVGVNVLQKGGELSDGVRMLSYKSCDPGYYNLKNDSTGIYECIECALGDYNLASESFSCAICPVGSYCSSSSISSCETIISGSSSPTGSTDVSDCVCPSTFLDDGGVCSCDVGFGYDGDSCAVCSQDSIKTDISLSTCSSCKSDDPNSVSNENSTDCICGVGFVMVDDNCENCDNGMICDEVGSVLTSISLEIGHWRESSTDLSTRECPYEQACTGSSDISNQCADGHSGPLCAVCADGYDSGSRFEKCESCFEGSSSFSFYTLLVVVIIVVGLLLAGVLKHSAIASLFVSLIASPSVRVKLKIFLIYCQIISQFQSILSADYPSNYASFLSVLQIFNFDLSSILSLKCFNAQYTFHDEMMVSTLLPIFICMFLVIGYFKSSFLSGDPLTRQKNRSGLIEWLLFVLYFFFASSSRAVFEIFNCDNDFESGSSYLRADYRLECNGPTYESYRSYAIIMIFVYPIGIPVLFFSVLFPHRSTIDMTALEASQGLETFLSFADRHEIVVARRLREVLEDYQASQLITMKKIENRRLKMTCCSGIEDRLKIEYSRILPALIPFAFLYEAYKPEYWYWECIECVRRLSLTGLLVFLYPGTEKQIALAMIICAAFIILFSWARPFLDPIHNFIIGSAKWGIFLQLFGTLLLKQHLFDGSYDSIGDLMIAAGVLFPVLPMLLWRGWLDSLKKAFTTRSGEIGVPSRESIQFGLKGYLGGQGLSVENPMVEGEKGPKL